MEQRRLLAVVLFEDFEVSGSGRQGVVYTPIPADNLTDILNQDYFGQIGPGSGLPLAISYSNTQGTGFYGAQDTDGTNSGDVNLVTLNWTGINVASFNNLNLSWFVAEDDVTDGSEDWDTTSSVRIEVQFDGGGFVQVFGIESEIGTDGNQTNEAPHVDTDFDTIGDGAEITDVFTQFNTALGNGLTLDIRLTIEDLDTGDEDIAFDNLLLTGDVASNPPAVVSFTRLTPATGITNADSLAFRATFSEDVQNVTADDFTANGSNATATGISPISASTYDVTVSGGDLTNLNGTVGLDLASGQNIQGSTGLALPNTEPPIDQTYAVDNTAPAINSIQRQDPISSTTDADTLAFRVTFNENVQNVDINDFAANGTTATPTSITAISASVYDVRISGGDLEGLDGNVGLDLGGSQNISDLAGNALPAGDPATDETYVVDNSAAPTTILLEDFEDATITYSPTPVDSLGNAFNSLPAYYGRVFPPSTIPADVFYSNHQGSGFYGAQNIDDASVPTTSVTLEWTGVNIASFTNLDLSWFVAEDDATDGNEDWDLADSVRLSVNLDNTGFTNIFAIEGASGTVGNQVPRVDTNFDGIGDGVEITDAFAEFNNSIADGTTLDIRLTIDNMGTGDEDIAFDQLKLTGDPIDVAPTVVSFVRMTPPTSPTSADSLVFRATFSESVQNVDIGDFDVTGTSATATGIGIVNASTYDVTVSGGDLAGLDGTVGLDLAAGQNIADLGGKLLSTVEPAVDETYSVDNTAPSIVSFVRQEPAVSPTDADTLLFRVTFSEDVQNVGITDFAATGTSGAPTSMTAISGSVFDVRVSGGDLAELNGTVELDLAGGQDIVDIAGNSLPTGEPITDESYLVDNTAAPTTLLLEDFEDADLTYVTSLPDSLGNINGDINSLPGHYGRVFPPSALPAGISYSDHVGSGFYGAHNLDNATNPASAVSLNWTGINIAGFTNLDLSWFVAEADATDGMEDWEGTDSVRIDVQIDGGGFNPIFAVEAIDDGSGTAGAQVNQPAAVDTNFDGVGDGDIITDVFTKFGTTITNGTTLDIRLTFESMALFDEDLAFDNLMLVGDAPDPNPPELLSFEREAPATSPTNASSLTFRATFNEPVQNVDPADFAANGTTASINVIPINATTFGVELFGGDLPTLDGVVGIDLAAGQDITDLSGNPLPAGEPAIDQTYVLDHDAPNATDHTGQSPTQNFDTVQPSLAVNYLIALTGLFPSQNGTVLPRTDSEPLIGELRMFGGNFAPSGWALAKGQLLSINQNTALFSILGTTYGGDGRTTFGLPDLRGRVPVGADSTEIRLGQKIGSERVRLTSTNQIAEHDHGVTGSADRTGKAGGNAAHSNLQPVLGLTAMINFGGTIDDVGELAFFAGSFAPSGWLKADGQTLDRTSFSNLFSKIGTIYGSDSGTTFRIPDLRGVTPIGQGSGPGLDPISLGQLVGQHDNIVTLTELTAHDHAKPQVDAAGGGDPILNYQPSVGVNFVTRTRGFFPSGGGGSAFGGFYGEIAMYAGTLPTNLPVAPNDGTLLPIAQNTALFSIFGTTFGGDGEVTFGLPSQSGRSAAGEGSGPGLTGRGLGQQFGAPEYQLTELNMPRHFHTLGSIVRQNPSDEFTNADSLVFRVSFTEAVQNVDETDFAVDATTSAGVTGINAIDASIYDLTVSGGDLANFSGIIDLDFAAGQDITDLAGNAYPGGEPPIDESYFIDNLAPEIFLPPDILVEVTEPTDPSNTGEALATDNIDPTPTIEFSDVITPGVSPQDFTITRTWTATDAAGNSSSGDQIINVVAPVAATIDDVSFFNKDAALEDTFSPDSTGQRSIIQHVQIVIDGAVTVPTGPVVDGSFAVQQIDNGLFVGLNVDSVTTAAGKTTVVLSFTSGVDSFGSLVNGNYLLVIDGAPLGIDANGSGAIGGVDFVDFHRLYGDSDGDRDVDGADFLNMFLAFFGVGDLTNAFDNADDDDLMNDVNAFYAQFGKRLVPSI